MKITLKEGADKSATVRVEFEPETVELVTKLH